MVVVRPEATDEVLGNPGMGWETFHRVRTGDRSLPDWIPSTVHYARWGWGVLEPEPGRIDHAFLDRELSESRQAGQTLAFRVMCCSSTPGKPYHPGWLKDVGGRELLCTYSGKELVIPDLDDPAVLERHLDFIRRLGECYDGHPDLDHLDLGSVGWWGEWHLSATKGAVMPTAETQKRIVDAYLAAFSKTPLVMLVGAGEMLTYACRNGAGWRADCLGDMGGFSKSWCHMRKGYPGWIREAGVEGAWRRGPVAWESCWDMRRWVKEGWSLRFIFNYALALHASVINNKSAPLPPGDEVRAELERFLRRLGYRLVLRELRHAAHVVPGGEMKLGMAWQNTGSAPCYRPYRLAYRLRSTEGHARVSAGAVTVNKWMPGSVELWTDEFFRQPPDLPPGPVCEEVEVITIPADMPQGRYELAIAVVDGAEPQPVLKLGIRGRGDDGWYPLSSCDVRK